MTRQYVVPIGTDHFRKLVTLTSDDGKKSLFVDKTKFIKEVLNDGSEVILITRPRRFGKTINMSMLQHFLSAEVDGQPTKDLFNDLLISEDQAAMAYRGKYQVIFISLKEIKADNFIEARARIAEVMRQLYIQFAYLKSKLDPSEEKIFQSILDKNAVDVDLQNALLNLSKYLKQEHKTTTYLLIDEYDSAPRAA